mgnify:CR=1 FL=1
MKNKTFLVWLLITSLTLFGAAVAGWYGLWGQIFDKDHTNISWLIVAMYCATSGYIGWGSYTDHYRSDYEYNILQYITASMMPIGMIGSVTGFLLFGDAFAQLDPSNMAAAQGIMKEMAIGVSTLMITTLLGLVAWVGLGYQLAITENA